MNSHLQQILPPIELKNGKIRPIILNATFYYLEIFDIDEVDSTFDIHFILEIEWFDQSLTFEFLHTNDFENFLYKRNKEKIWTPKIEFSEMKQDISTARYVYMLYKYIYICI